MARVEGEEIVKVLLDKFKKIELAIEVSELQWRADVALRGLTALPVSLGR